MGLDTSWYRGLKKRDDVIFDGEGEPTNVDDYCRPYVNSYFPKQADNIEDRAIYEYETSGDDGWHGGYGRYSGWRNWLAKIAGYPEGTYEQYGKDWPSHCVECWNGKKGPFSELINFSDCEGVIGPKTSAKLAKDFARFDDKAKADGDEYQYAAYCSFRKAFEEAANNGCVSFH